MEALSGFFSKYFSSYLSSEVSLKEFSASPRSFLESSFFRHHHKISNSLQHSNNAVAEDLLDDNVVEIKLLTNYFMLSNWVTLKYKVVGCKINDTE